MCKVVILSSVAYNILQQPFQDIHSLSHHLGVIWTKHLKEVAIINTMHKHVSKITNFNPLGESKKKSL